MRPAHLSPHHGQQVSGRSTSLPCVCVCVVSCLCDTSGSIAARTTRRQRPHIQTARVDRHLLDYKYEVLLRDDGLRLCVSATADTVRPGDTTRTYENQLALFCICVFSGRPAELITQPSLLFAISDFLSFALPKPSRHHKRDVACSTVSPLLFGHLHLRWASSLLVRLACIGSSIPHSSHDSWSPTCRLLIRPPGHARRAAAALWPSPRFGPGP